MQHRISDISGQYNTGQCEQRHEHVKIEFSKYTPGGCYDQVNNTVLLYADPTD